MSQHRYPVRPQDIILPNSGKEGASQGGGNTSSNITKAIEAADKAKPSESKPSDK